jgi:hypothetical protein
MGNGKWLMVGRKSCLPRLSFVLVLVILIDGNQIDYEREHEH